MTGPVVEGGRSSTRSGECLPIYSDYKPPSPCAIYRRGIRGETLSFHLRGNSVRSPTLTHRQYNRGHPRVKIELGLTEPEENESPPTKGPGPTHREGWESVLMSDQFYKYVSSGFGRDSGLCGPRGKTPDQGIC